MAPVCLWSHDFLPSLVLRMTLTISVGSSVSSSACWATYCSTHCTCGQSVHNTRVSETRLRTHQVSHTHTHKPTQRLKPLEVSREYLPVRFLSLPLPSLSLLLSLMFVVLMKLLYLHFLYLANNSVAHNHKDIKFHTQCISLSPRIALNLKMAIKKMLKKLSV